MSSTADKSRTLTPQKQTQQQQQQPFTLTSCLMSG